MDKHLHIVSLNVPLPADYGGVVDIFYRIKALSESGVKIHLHCFDYGRGESKRLLEFCTEVAYYQRPLSLCYQFSHLPFIVITRSDRRLLKKLCEDEYPILFEGLHSCFFLGSRLLKSRKKIVRCHNIEHDYYRALASREKMVIKRLYLNIESIRLKYFEKVLVNADRILAISDDDFSYFQARYGKTLLMPPGHPSEKVKILKGKGDFILYHGNLSVPENIEAALYIIDEIAPLVGHRFVIAGKSPEEVLYDRVSSMDNVELIANPSDNELQQLIADAQINLLPTFQSTGFKLKLLNALFNGRFCLGTPQLTAGTGLESLCITATDAVAFIKIIDKVMLADFTTDMIEARRLILETRFANSKSSEVILGLLS
jgi:glycosyltransferase involved in cell wall biosynthesis